MEHWLTFKKTYNTLSSLKPEQEKGMRERQTLMMLAVFLFIAAANVCVYFTGGTDFAFTHIMYLPIVMAAFYWGHLGAALCALAGGITLALMPANLANHTVQLPASWAFRLAIFVIIGQMMAFLFRTIQKFKASEIETSLNHVVTGLPNMNRLKLDLDAFTAQKKPFALAAFKITNLDNINRYLDYNFGVKSVFRALDIIRDKAKTKFLYSIFTNEAAVILPGAGAEEAIRAAREILDEFQKPIAVDGFSVELVLKAGIVCYPVALRDSSDLIKKMSIALAQDCGPSGLCVYDAAMEENDRMHYEITLALYKALEKNEFRLVYQPKMNLRDGTIAGYEALLRWNYENEPVSPEVFVRIAEDVGIIGDITKWVIRHAVDQMALWQQMGMRASVSINISSRDLANPAVMEYLHRYIRESGIDPALMELELTERMIVDNDSAARRVLQEARESGMRVALDDYGTGYNSLTVLAKLPVDCLKVDKRLTDHVTEKEHRILLEGVIRSAHQLGKDVVAEGVEEEAQVQALAEIGCDAIQGYYFSKPLPPERIWEFAAARGEIAREEEPAWASPTAWQQMIDTGLST